MSKIVRLLAVLIVGVVMPNISKAAGNPSDQYCTTKEIITIRDDVKVSSETKVQCSDDQLGKLIEVRTGHYSNCGYSINNIMKGNVYVRQKVFHCRDTDGTIITLFDTDLR